MGRGFKKKTRARKADAAKKEPSGLKKDTLDQMRSVSDYRCKPVLQCNWKCYLKRYPDLRRAFGANIARAAAHYRHHGKKEGRNCKCQCDREWCKTQLPQPRK